MIGTLISINHRFLVEASMWMMGRDIEPDSRSMSKVPPFRF